jgi:hypothetical protein
MKYTLYFMLPPSAFLRRPPSRTGFRHAYLVTVMSREVEL